MPAAAPATTAICPVREIGRQLEAAILAYDQADEALASDPEDGATANALRRRQALLYDRQRCLEIAATFERPTCVAGACIQVMLIALQIDRLRQVDCGEACTAIDDAHGEISRLAHGVVGFLVEEFSLELATLQEHTMPSRLDPLKTLAEALGEGRA